MAELFGVATGALGAVGLLAQLFDGCVKAYGYFSSAARLDADAQRLLTKVRIEEMRLVVWGREWGVAEGLLERRLAEATGTAGPEVGRERLKGGGPPQGLLAGGPQLRVLAEQILTELYNTITDFRKLQERYGLVAEDAAGGAAAGGNGGGKTLEPEDRRATHERKNSNSGRLSPGNKKSAAAAVKEALVGGSKAPGERTWRRDMALRAKWVIADKEKFSTLLRDLKDWNDALESLFPPSRVPSVQRAWQHELLQSAQRSVSELSLLERASEGVYRQLHDSASLKKLRINLDTVPQDKFRPTFALRVPRDALTLSKLPSSSTLNVPSAGASSGSNPRSIATYLDNAAGGKSVPVLIEWVAYDRNDPEERFLHMRRLDDLARMLRGASERHPDLHTLDCVGYTDDAGDGTTNSRYGLVYRMPDIAAAETTGSTDVEKVTSKLGAMATTPPAQSPTYSSLLNLLTSSDLKTPSLDARVALAHTLAVALWSLHSLDWLHKSLCSANVLFFPSAVSASATKSTATAAVVPDISRPFLVGFDASRPEFETEMSVSPKNPSILDLHRHPRLAAGGGGGMRAKATTKKPSGGEEGTGGAEGSSSDSAGNNSGNSGAYAGGGGRMPYCKSFDMYSLGLVLLEIGLWKPLQTFYRPHYSADRWRDRVIMPVLLPGLDAKTGRRFRDVVELCLTADEDLSSQEAGQLMEDVVARLESIRV